MVNIFSVYNCVPNCVATCANCVVTSNVVQTMDVTSFGSSSFSCVSCSRQYHRECVEELALPKSTLCCKMVKRHLAKDGSELLEPVYESRERPILRDKMCLVCGGDTRGVCDVISL